MHVTVAAWAATVLFIAGLLAVDWLLVRGKQVVSFREAVWMSVLYIAVALLFGVVLGLVSGWDIGVQYYAGYLVEKSLSIDNLFVFVIIIGAFAVPAELQPRALTLGIVLALILRTVFIAIGAALLEAFSFMFLIFGAGLIATGVQLFRNREEDPSLDDNRLLGLARRKLRIADDYDGARLTVQSSGTRVFTPMALVLVAIGSTDVLFALDSIPAVFGVTSIAYIVFCANAFSLLGLRALYFLVTGLLSRLVYLSTGLSVILVFIGIKLVLEFVHHHAHSVPTIATGPSLAIVATILAVTAVASIAKTRREPKLRAHAGSLRERRPRN